jgi:hypothetical protein
VRGVESAAVCLTLPYERALNVGARWRDAKPPNDQIPILNMTYVTPGYFEVLRIPVVRGRVFTAADAPGAPPVIVVNEALVRRYSADRDPIGRPFGGSTVIGVVGDIQQKAGWGGIEPVSAVPAAYVPAAQYSNDGFKMVHTWFSPSWIVRTAGPQAGIAAEMQRAVQAVDPLLPFAKFRTLHDVRGEALAKQRSQAVLLGSLAGLALLVAAIGIYALVSSSVAERTRELGIRMALGATPVRIFSVAARPGLAIGVTGLALGLAIARAGARVMTSLVWGVAVGDPITFALAGGVVLLVVVSATSAPALRIVRLNPVRALRHT